jgi:hypothetical protein
MGFAYIEICENIANCAGDTGNHSKHLIVDPVSRPATYGEVTLSELACLVLGTPISLLNLWAWMEPEIVESYFSGLKNRNH